MSPVEVAVLRAQFAERLSEVYGREVPAYTRLVEASSAVNRQVMMNEGVQAERLGSVDRVTAERHGAIRVGTPEELNQVARILGAFGMHPVGFYDLRDTADSSIPVVSTACRPIDAAELDRNPFRVFCSMLVPEDRRFFDASMQARLEEFLGARRIFGDRLLELADKCEATGLSESEAEEFLTEAVAAFEISSEPVPKEWYRELEQISAVAADIGGVTSTHINHLTPRVRDIDELYRVMSASGITMIDAIQGPPRWEGPDLLLRQTSFRALEERRRFIDADGEISEGSLRVRFGEVEARGIAPTPEGRRRYEEAIARIEAARTDGTMDARNDAAAAVWREYFPDSEQGLHRDGLAYFTYAVPADRPGAEPPAAADVEELLSGGWLVAEPIVYEDFLPRSAAGIFSSNLVEAGAKNGEHDGAGYDLARLSTLIGRPIADPDELYRQQSQTSLNAATDALGLPRTTPTPAPTVAHI